MGAITATATQVSPLDNDRCKIFDVIAAVDINAGQSCFVNTSGKADLASTTTAGAHNSSGIAVKSVKAGMVVPLQYEGPIGGFDLSAVAFGATVYQSDTAGVIQTTAGTVTVPLGKVMPTTQLGSIGKALHLAIDMRTTY